MKNMYNLYYVLHIIFCFLGSFPNFASFQGFVLIAMKHITFSLCPADDGNKEYATLHNGGISPVHLQ